jgi:hypothetical protein
VPAQPSKPAMLDRIDDLVEALKANRSVFFGQVVQTGSLYCPACGAERRMSIWILSTPKDVTQAGAGGFVTSMEVEKFVPTLLRLACVQCEAKFTGVIYEGPDGPDAVILPSIRGGLTTPNTPKGVAYYLDQAHRADVVGARSAAVSMYRAALDSLLFEQGYTVRMCGKKLEKLEADIAAGTAPKWAADLNTEFLAVLKALGDASIHPNDGDVTTQDALDAELVRKVRETFLYLLYLVYEAPHERDKRLTALRVKAQELTRGGPSSGGKP